MLGIIILNYQTWEETIECIESIFANVTLPFHIYVVDNDSENNSYEIISKKYATETKVTVVQSGRNGGYSFGNNYGMRLALKGGCKTALICNNDIVFLPDSVEQMVDLLWEKSDIGLVASTLIDNNGKVQPRGFGRISCTTQALSLWTEKLLKKDILKSLRIVDAEEPSQAYRVNGGCFVIKMEAYKLIGKFDENTFLYYEESILARSLEKVGYRVFFHDKAMVIHDHSATISMLQARYYKELVKSELYYFKNYERSNFLALMFLYVTRLFIYTTNCFKNPNYRETMLQFLKETTTKLTKRYNPLKS